MYSSTAKDDNIQNLKNSARTVADDATGNLRDTANKAGLQLRNFIDTATGEISHASDVVTSRINEKPLQSSVIALGIGVVLGLLLRRS